MLFFASFLLHPVADPDQAKAKNANYRNDDRENERGRIHLFLHRRGKNEGENDSQDARHGSRGVLLKSCHSKSGHGIVYGKIGKFFQDFVNIHHMDIPKPEKGVK